MSRETHSTYKAARLSWLGEPLSPKQGAGLGGAEHGGG